MAVTKDVMAGELLRTAGFVRMIDAGPENATQTASQDRLLTTRLSATTINVTVHGLESSRHTPCAVRGILDVLSGRHTACACYYVCHP